MSSFPLPLVGAPPASIPYLGLALPAWPSCTPDGPQPIPPYTTLQRPNQQSGGGSSSSLYSTLLSAPQGQSDELYIQYSPVLLGSFPSYRNLPLPPNLTCFECGAFLQHYCGECPASFLLVRGEPSPGWWVDQLGAVVKDPAAWIGQEFTDAARVQFYAFLDKPSLVEHGTHPVSRDDTLGPAPAPLRSPLLRPGGGRRQGL